MENFFKYFTPITYWVLVIIWLYIFIFYFNKIKNNWKQDKLLGLLLLVLSIDAFRTLFESIYFGAWYTSLSGLIPIQIFDFLKQPQIVFFPKIINLIAAVIVLIILINKWLPLEIIQKDKIKNLVEEQTSELLEKNKELNASTNALKESEEKFRIVFENSPVGKSITGVDASLHVNQSFCDIVGYTEDELREKTWMDISHPDDIEQITEITKSLLSGELSQVNFEKRYIHKNGNIISTDVSTYLQRDNNGKPQFFITSVFDITKRKLAEEKLKESETKFRALYDNAPLSYQSLNEDGSFKDVNPNWLSTLGYQRDEVIGKFYKDFLHPKWTSHFEDNFPKFKARGYVKDVQFKILHKDGHYLDIEFEGCIGYHPDGSFKQTYCVFQDITERKQAEERLKESEIKFRNAIMYAPYPIMIHSEGKVLQLSEEWTKQTGYTIQDIPTIKEWSLKAYGEEAIPSNEFIENLYKIDKAQNDGEWKVKIKNGEYRLWDFSTSPIGTLATGKKMVISMASDITERKKLEESMQRAHKLESLGVLAGGIAHDFNNLLSGIFGYTEMAIAQTTEEKVSSYLSESLSNIGRARALTQQLLTFAKGGIPIKKTEKLFPFVKEAVQFALSGSSVSSEFQVEDNLWACDLDKNQIGQVIDNLTINAQQAMPNGGNIEISAQNISLSEEEHTALSAGNYVKLSIKDQGIGIPKEFLPRIFDPYYTTKPKGHGLGLATCYSIINRHNGLIDVESKLGKGSVFHVYLPALLKSVSPKVKKISGKHKGSGTFLVMDDDKVICDLMKVMLEAFGYTVVLKYNGEDTIDFFAAEIKAKRKVAGMIFDLTIPGGMGGKETIKEVRKLCPNTIVFVSSGYSADPIIANPQDYGFNASISKPFMLNELSEMLEKYMK